ncbi:MAG: hypothetical protein Q9190_002211 [Brigantiaea leucoxantha]
MNGASVSILLRRSPTGCLPKATKALYTPFAKEARLSTWGPLRRDGLEQERRASLDVDVAEDQSHVNISAEYVFFAPIEETLKFTSLPVLRPDSSSSTLSSSSSGLQKAEGQQSKATELPRLPRSVQAIYLRPLKRKAPYGLPCCDLQLRSYNVRNVEFFADFALRAAYYLHLPAVGPIPLPRITERWTVPRSHFIFKKSQENFERITLRRLIQIQDGHPETVEMWLAFLRKHAYYGVGLKANIWEHEKLGVGKTMDVSLENLKQKLEPKWAHFGRRRTPETSERVLELMNSAEFRQISDGPMT